MTSTVTLTLTIEHADNLTAPIADAKAIARCVAAAIGEGIGLAGPWPIGQWGRVVLIGPEDGPSVRVFIDSAAIASRPDVRTVGA